MTDIMTAEQRAALMAKIRAKNTVPEITVRRILHGMGFRFRLHDARLPGKPDVVLPRHRTVVLVHGCFWHGHDCHLFRVPKSRAEWWRDKIDANRRRDTVVLAQLVDLGWRIVIVRECALKGRTRLALDALATALAEAIFSSFPTVTDIRGVEREPG
jgi:DNA mismatch endonuclease (patch repair protein)